MGKGLPWEALLDARSRAMSCGRGCIGGRGALSSAIIRAMSSLDTWRSRRCCVTEEGRVVTRIGVLGLDKVDTGLRWEGMLSMEGKGVVGRGVAAVEHVCKEKSVRVWTGKVS